MANESIKLEQEELQQIAQIQQVSQNITMEYGNIELSKKALQARVERADEALEALRENEQELAKALEEKYGQGSIDLQEGTFESSKEETKIEEESAE
jgi:allophanate hydrolase subunit 1